MNHRNAIPANGRRFKARLILLELLESHVPASCGLRGIDIRMSTTMIMSSIEKMIPAMAAARGVLSRRRDKAID